MPPTSRITLLEHKARLSGLTPEAYDAHVQAVLYRRGFILTDSRQFGGASNPVTDTWHEYSFGPYKLHVHPDAQHSHRQSNSAHISLIGHAFDAVNSAYTADELLAEIETAHSTSRLDTLFDTLSGRYRVIVIDASGARVWHDPMGAAAVYYTELGGACASHADLLSRTVAAPVADWFVPFLSSPNYRARDVKYLPGLLSPYDSVLQLTPNTRLDVTSGEVRRFWPRQPIGPQSSDAAERALALHLSGLRRSLEVSALLPLIGLTGGTDSRGILAACIDLDPTLFTYVYSSTGDTTHSDDVTAAQRLAAHYGQSLHVLPAKTRKSLNDVTNPDDESYRRSTAYFRGNADHWAAAAAGLATSRHIFVRGSGGEILRGFYQTTQQSIHRLSASQLARAYDVNAGSAITRGAFAHFIQRTDAEVAVDYGIQPDDLLYWEHRMGTWGSISLSQADLRFPATVAYSSRHLYAHFLSLGAEERSSREPIHSAFEQLRPGIMTIPTA